MRFGFALALALLLATCGEPAPAFDAKGVQLVVELRDYSVTASVPTLKAGAAKIGIRNLAAQVHDLVFIRTDLAPDKLPYDAAQAKVVETGAVGKAAEVQPQRSGALTVTLDPGSYVLICNLPGHYQLGMHTTLKVEP